MKKPNILILTMALVFVLSLSTVIAISQAWGPKKSNPEYAVYDLKVLYGPVNITNVDASGAPELIIMEHIIETAVECTLKIGDKVYSYPDDFDIAVTHYVELNSLTGNGLARTEGTFTFKLNGQPTLTFWGVSRFVGLRQTPDGTLVNPEDFKGQGEFELTGTGLLNKVEGFGIGDTMFYPPEYTNQYVHQIGFIKGLHR